MGKATRKKLIGINAIALLMLTLASFVLPLILDSALDGRANFIKAMAHVFPLLMVIPVSCKLIALAGYDKDSSP